ncbi:hypothetical protein [Putridiphycobacter roseus]|nr:hypothetical protein [Putridiphycobacter roseus]
MKYQPYLVAMNSDQSIIETATYTQVKTTELLNDYLVRILKVHKSSMVD